MLLLGWAGSAAVDGRELSIKLCTWRRMQHSCNAHSSAAPLGWLGAGKGKGGDAAGTCRLCCCWLGLKKMTVAQAHTP